MAACAAPKGISPAHTLLWSEFSTPSFFRGRVDTATWFWPEVLRVRRVAAQLERDQVILFVVGKARVKVAVLADLLLLEGVRVARRRPDCGRIAAYTDGRADVVLGDPRFRDARSADRVG